MSCILLATLFFILETVTPIYNLSPDFFYFIESFTSIIFTIEYISRLLVCKSNREKGYINFIISPINIVDLAAILPFYVELLAKLI